MITPAKTGRLPDADTHPDFRTLLGHKAFLSTWCRTYMFTREKQVFFLNTLKISLAPPPQEETVHVMFVRNQHTQEPKEAKVCDWNHLLFSVVTAEPTSRRDRGLKLTQPHFAAQAKTCEREGQNATKITSALADSCIQSLWPVMSILMRISCLCLALMNLLCSHCVTFFPTLRPWQY